MARPIATVQPAGMSYSREVLTPWLPVLYQTLDPLEIIPSLMERGFFDDSAQAEIIKESIMFCDDKPRVDKIKQLVEYIIYRNENSMVCSFLQVLKEKDYHYQWKWITQRQERDYDCEDQHKIFRMLIPLFAEELCKTIYAAEFLPFVIQSELVSGFQIEKINSHKTNMQKVLGILHYMSLSRKEDWPARFLHALLEAGSKLRSAYTDLANAIEPKLDPVLVQLPEIQQRVVDLTKANIKYDNERTALVISGETSGQGEVDTFEAPPSIGSSPHSVETSVGHEALSTLASVALCERDRLPPDGASVCGENSPEVDIYNRASQSIQHDESQRWIANEGRNENVYALERFIQEDQQTDTEGDRNAEVLQLRSYQEELAKPALEGINTVIVAPTGSGKTVVAVKIAEEHLQSAAVNEHCVAFLVPVVHLVEQQAALFRKFLPHRKIYKAEGNNSAESGIPLSGLLEETDVIVMTPQILVNAMEKEGDTLLSSLTLIVFDECHETRKEHQYNKIMGRYLDAKIKRVSYSLPQIVGLTASVGVGKAKDEQGAVKHIIKLCASLDAAKIQTVKHNIETLIKYISTPTDDVKPVQGRKNDEFKKTIVAIMEKMESEMKKIPEKEYDDEKEIGRNLHPPSERNAQPYTNWISLLERNAPKIFNQMVRRVFIAAIERLKVLHRALELNDDCESSSALEYIKTQWQKPHLNPPANRQPPQEISMHRLFLDQEHELEEICLREEQRNPKLLALHKILYEEYMQNKDCRIIIFVRTIELTNAMTQWVESNPDISMLKPKPIVGGRELTSQEQKCILDDFRDGKHQLLISTSVSEEGLDVAKCNLVIRYEYVSSDIARVQARGRARAKQARYILVTEREMGRDWVNSLKESIMGNALNIVDSMTQEEFKKKIEDEQEKAKFERDMARRAAQSKRRVREEQAKESFILYCRCDRYVCNEQDLRTVNNQHHVVIDPAFFKLCIQNPAKKSKHADDMEITGKIYCNVCSADWGVISIYKYVKYPCLKTKKFLIEYKNENNVTVRLSSVRRWQDLPIKVKEITHRDMQRQMSSTDSQDSDDTDEEI